MSIALRLGLCVLAACSTALVSAQSTETAPTSVNAPAMIRRSIVEFGAVPDAKTLNTAAIQKAIEAVAAAGGGVLEIPMGTFRSGSLFLRQNVDLYLAEGAVLLGSNNIEDYPKQPTRIEGHVTPWRMALLNVQNLSRVRISGPGKLDGNGILFWASFWQRRKENAKATNLEVERPRLMFVDTCTDVRIEGISLQDSGFWNLHLYRCREVVIDGVRINAPTKGNVLAPSSDGIDVDSSQNVVIRNCKISVNDDNIAMKGSKGPLADQDASSPPVENILIENCEFGDGNAALTCGSEATVVRNITMRNIRITGDNKLLMLKLRPDTPQHYENILIDGVTLSGEGRIIHLAPWLQFFDLKGHPSPERVVRHVTIRNVSGSYGHFGDFRPGEGDTIQDLVFENVDVTLEKPVLRTNAGHAPIFRNVRVNGKPLADTPTSAAR